MTPTPIGGGEPNDPNRLDFYLPLVFNRSPLTFSVSGRIVDGQNSPLVGVVLTTNGGRTTTTDSNGNYSFNSLPPGDYSIEPSLANYSFLSKSVQVNRDLRDINFVGFSTITPTPTQQPSNPSPTSVPGPGNTPTPVSGGSCSQLIRNGGFESGDSWLINVNEYPASYSSSQVFSGGRSMRIGIVNPADNRYSYSSIEQTITVPNDASTIKLRYQIYSTATGSSRTSEGSLPDFNLGLTPQPEGTNYVDSQFTLIIDQWDQIHILMNRQATNHGWAGHEFELNDFRGQTVRVYFGVLNNGWDGIASSYIDDVSVTVDGSGNCSP